MVANPLLQWMFTVAFSGLSLFYLYKLVTATRALELVSHLLHLVMSVAMLAMAWPWWNVVPPIWQLSFFLACTLWYLLLTSLILLKNLNAQLVGGHGVFHQIAHLVMMASMSWMIFSMLDAGSGHIAASQTGASAEVGAGTGVVTGTGAGTEAIDHVHLHNLTEPVLLVGICLTGLLLVAAVWFILQVVEDSQKQNAKHRNHIEEMIASAVMSAGMALMNMLAIFT